MANSFTEYQRGDRWLYTNAGSAITNGNIVAIASGTTGFVGVAVEDIAATTGTGTLDVTVGRIFAGPKTSGEAWTAGQIIYWDGTALSSTSTTTSTRAGRTPFAAASAATTGYVAINT